MRLQQGLELARLQSVGDRAQAENLEQRFRAVNYDEAIEEDNIVAEDCLLISWPERFHLLGREIIELAGGDPHRSSGVIEPYQTTVPVGTDDAVIDLKAVRGVIPGHPRDEQIAEIEVTWRHEPPQPSDPITTQKLTFEEVDEPGPPSKEAAQEIVKRIVDLQTSHRVAEYARAGTLDRYVA